MIPKEPKGGFGNPPTGSSNIPSPRPSIWGKTEAWKPLTGEYIPIMRGDEVQKYIPLPAYGEVKLICHDGKIKYIETTTKEKVE